MKIPKSTSTDSGYAMLLALGFMLIMLILLASMLNWSNQNATVTLRNNQYVASQYAAEAAAETVISRMSSDFYDQGLSNANYYSTLLPTNTDSWPIQYQFSDPVSVQLSNVVNRTYVSPILSSTNMVPLESAYDGLWAQVQTAQITSEAAPLNQRYNVPATVTENVTFASIPIFQFVIFYNLDLEIDPGQSMPVKGNVFSNRGIWSGTDNVNYGGVVWAVNQVNTSGTDPFGNHSVDSGTSSANFIPGQPVSGVKPITLPVAGSDTNNSPALVESILQWPPDQYALGTSAAYSTNGQVYLANAVDLIISNSVSGINSSTPTGTNFTLYYQDPSKASPLILVTNDFYVITNKSGIWLRTNYIAPGTLGPGTNVQYAGYTFLTNVVFHDWREAWNNGNGVGGKGKTVQAVQFDVPAFYGWLTNKNVNGTTNKNGGQNYNQLCVSDKDHYIDRIYIYSSVSLDKTTIPAVRVVNGSQLYDPKGLSIATPMPLYVLGDFNVTDGVGSNAGQNSTTHARPASFFADSITILSTNWDDSKGNKKNLSASPSTTINAACLEGIVPSDKNIDDGDGDSYSGGVENFLRLLEDWGSSKLYYNGSIIVMFPSQYATNRWRNTGNYYDAPQRHWAFDTNFLDPNKLPPLTPHVKTVIRNGWTAQ